MARHLHPVCALGQEGRLGSGIPGDQRRSRPGRSDDRQHGCSRPPPRRGRPKEEGPQALGRARGGFGTKIHVIVDALGNPIGLTLTGAHLADIGEAPVLLDQAPDAGAVLADQGYGAEALVERIQAAGAHAIILPRSNRKTPRPYDKHHDKHRYKARNLVERFSTN